MKEIEMNLENNINNQLYLYSFLVKLSKQHSHIMSTALSTLFSMEKEKENSRK